MDALPVTSLVRQNQKRKQKGNNDRKETAVHGKPIDWVFTVCFFLLGPAYLERVGVRSRRRRRCATAASGSAAGTARWCGTSPAVRPVHTQNHQSNSVKTRSRKKTKKPATASRHPTVRKVWPSQSRPTQKTTGPPTGSRSSAGETEAHSNPPVENQGGRPSRRL